jgi:hypothetical protein
MPATRIPSTGYGLIQINRVAAESGSESEALMTGLEIVERAEHRQAPGPTRYGYGLLRNKTAQNYGSVASPHLMRWAPGN